MRYGSLWERLVRGVRWSWIDPRYQSALPPDLDASVMTLDSRDRLHAKQGRSTARVVFHPAAAAADRASGTAQCAGASAGPVAVYLKRHFRLPWLARLAALFDPAGRHSPAAAEWAHLERARALGVPVPEVVATGERIGPWACLQSYLMVAELYRLPGTERRPARTGVRTPARCVRVAQAAADRRDGPDHRYLAHGSRVPQRPVSLPLLPRSRATSGRSGRRPTGPDRLPSPGRAPSLARPLALEGPGPTALLNRGCRRDR